MDRLGHGTGAWGWGQNGEVILSEYASEPRETFVGFRLVQVMTAPQNEGRYLLRALYRGAKLFETTQTVLPQP